MTTIVTSSRHAIMPAPVVARRPQSGERYPRHEVGVPPGVHRSGRYALRFATTLEDLRAAQRLRFEVFNLELAEGLHESYRTGLAIDAFDARCHHLLVCDDDTGDVVGTYRLMPQELATRARL